MAINAKKVAQNQGNRVQQANIEPGVYPARLVQIIDLGVQPQRAYEGKEKPPAQEIMLTYELVDEFMKDEDGNDLADKPRWISENFVLHNLNADMAKSTKRYLAFDPTQEHDGDWGKLIGAAINVTIINNKKQDKVYDNVANLSAMRPKDAVNCPELVNETKVFDIDDPDMEVYASLPEWIQKKLLENLNFKGSALEALVAKQPPKEDKKKAEPAPKKDRKAPAEDEDDAVDDKNDPY